MATDDLTALEAAESEAFERKPARSGLGAGVAVLLALGALAVSGLVWWEGRDDISQDNSRLEATLEQLRQAQARQVQNLSDLTARVDDASNDPSGDRISGLESTLEAQVAQNQDLRGDLEAQQLYTRTLQQAIESLQARLMVVETGLTSQAPSLTSSPDQFNLAGVEYLLRLAPERLTLYHDVRAADEALASADTQLAAMDNPVYLGLRQHIAEARQALADTSLPNQVELSASLDTIQQQLSALTFGGESVTPASQAENGNAESESGWWQRLKSSLASLVTVRRNAGDADSRLTLEDKDLIRQGLWMQVEGARLALMRHDQASWQDTLARAESVLNRWFDTSSEEYASVHQGLMALSAVSVSPALPDISGPWAQMQLIRLSSPSPVAPSPVAATVPPETEEAAAKPEASSSAQEDDSESGQAGEDETE